ncbi:MAG: endonuclease/exonuclease/phosphatase family protein [Oscillospiraceae bacterium]|nr:endonuclease/exonuclease/phosphatase family protein [Oscillospiraceae bacterium]
MRIVSWNCNGAFREKQKIISSINADIYVIQECENPDISHDVECKCFSDRFIWTGENKNRGLGIFLKNGIDFTENLWPKYGLRNFISIRINSDLNLLGVWACKPYIDEYAIYQNINYDFFNENTVIIGDFNSNSIWDSQHGLRNHSAVVAALKEKNLLSAYHYTRREEQGLEAEKTFFLHRNPSEGYHIDYCFLSPQRLVNFSILGKQDWLGYSDHMPLVVDIT